MHSYSQLEERWSFWLYRVLRKQFSLENTAFRHATSRRGWPPLEWVTFHSKESTNQRTKWRFSFLRLWSLPETWGRGGRGMGERIIAGFKCSGPGKSNTLEAWPRGRFRSTGANGLVVFYKVFNWLVSVRWLLSLPTFCRHNCSCFQKCEEKGADCLECVQ